MKTITAFTIGHSISLAAAAFGLIGVPERPLNACIALSIVFVGVEMVKEQRGETGLTARYPWVVAVAFGLVHGIGFASALAGLGTQRRCCPPHCFFNIGVEIGQLGFVLLVLALIWAHRRLTRSCRGGAISYRLTRSVRVAMFWFIGRLVRVLVALERRGCIVVRHVSPPPAGLLALIAILALTYPAFAHEQAGSRRARQRIAAPIEGLDHLIAMVAVGISGGAARGPAIWVLPVTFPLVMAFGGVLGVLGFPAGAGGGYCAVGSCWARRWRHTCGCRSRRGRVVGVFAIFHGHAHGAELPGAANPLAYGVGFVVSYRPASFVRDCRLARCPLARGSAPDPGVGAAIAPSAASSCCA